MKTNRQSWPGKAVFTGSLWVAFLCLFSACATIVAPKSGVVPIDTQPQGATVRYRDANVGVTPCSVKIDVGHTNVVLVRDGFHDQWLDVGRETSGWIIGNIVFGGIPGLLIDALGGGNVVQEDPCLVELTPVTESAPALWERPSSSAQPSPTNQWGDPDPAYQEMERSPLKPTRAPALPNGKQPPQPKKKSAEPTPPQYF